MRRNILRASDAKRLREESRQYGYYEDRFFLRWHAMWHNYYGKSVKEPWEDFQTIYTASCHTFYYRNRKKALAMEKRNRYYKRKNLQSQYGWKIAISPTGMIVSRPNTNNTEEIDA